MSRRTAAPRGGFTMIELLVVILIIALLVSLLSAAVIKVRAVAKRTAATAEIAQIANAIAAYKTKMNVGFIPAGGSATGTGNFRLRAQYFDVPTGTQVGTTSFEAIYLKSVFPSLPRDAANTGFVTGITVAQEADLDANQTLVLFLTGGVITNFTGFSTNRTNPFDTTATNRIGPFLDFPANKYTTAAASQSTNASANAASLLDPWGSPYAYFTFSTFSNSYMSTTFTFRGTVVSPYLDATKKPFLQKGFQLVSAGENGQDDNSGPYGFGPGGQLNVAGQWTPQAGAYAEGMAGADDLSNFNSGPLVIQN